MLNQQIERLINVVLGTDPDSVQNLAELDGKVLCIQLEAITLHNWLVKFQDGVIGIEPGDDETPVDATISGGPFGFIRGMSQPTDRRVFNDGGLQVTGDIRVVQRCTELVMAFDPDWQERLSSLIGDVGTYRVETLVDAIKSWLSDVREKVSVDGAEYLTEEARVLAPGPRINVFADSVDDLVASLERLEARINHLELSVERG